METLNRIARLKDIISSYGKVLVASSGGRDSSFLACVAASVLGAGARAVTVVSQFSLRYEIEMFGNFAKARGIEHLMIDTDLMGIEEVVRNDRERCYHCKKAVFSILRMYADNNGFDVIADGSNLSDDDDFRPGKKALAELGVESPLYRAGFTKQLIDAAARDMGIELPVLYSNSCLAARVEYDTRLTPEVLRMIELGEGYIRGLGFDPVRLRYHSGIARIELRSENVKMLINDDEKRVVLADQLKGLGFSHVTVDLEGYVSGSMNRRMGVIS